MTANAPDSVRPAGQAAGRPSGALTGVRVLDLGHAVAGPLCAALLADHGADVVKIEPPDGDQLRGVPPFPRGTPRPEFGAIFQFANRSKRGIVLDLKTPAGVDAFLRLVDSADVVVENFRAGVMERFGLGYEVLAARNPRLVYTSVRGFGDPRNGRTAYTDWPAVDIIAQAMGGLMSITGSDGPTLAGAVPGDTMPGLYAAFATVSAVLAARACGLGQHVDVGMIDTLVSLNEPAVTTYSATGEVPPLSGARLRNIAPFGRVRTRDGWAVLAVAPGRRNWGVFCELIGRPELAIDPRYATDPARVERSDEVYALVEGFTQSRDSAELLVLFGGKVPFVPIYDAADIARDPYFQARDMLVDVEHPGADHPVKVPGIPAKLSRTPGGVRGSAPRLGEHTDEVLAELGYTAEQIATLFGRAAPG